MIVKVEDALAECEAIVRRQDPDRYFSALFAPAQRRPLLFALYAFNCEVSRVGEASREPLMGAIRLQWWRETVEQARLGHPRAHPAAIGLAELFSRSNVQAELFEEVLDAREFDLALEFFSDVAALENYCDATSSGLMRISARTFNADPVDDAFLRHAGIAFAITGLLRAIPFHASRGKLYLPLDLLAAENVTAGKVFAGHAGQALARVMQTLSVLARRHLTSARQAGANRAARVSALPAALVPLYLRRVTRAGFDPLRDSSEVPLFRRQLALLRATTLGRL
jgi:phytoene synthase